MDQTEQFRISGRWLTVGFPGQPDLQLLLEKPGPPAHDDATAEQIRELITGLRDPFGNHMRIVTPK